MRESGSVTGNDERSPGARRRRACLALEGGRLQAELAPGLVHDVVGRTGEALDQAGARVRRRGGRRRTAVRHHRRRGGTATTTATDRHRGGRTTRNGRV